MKLSNETLNVLKNFAGINSGLEFKTGNTIKTISSTKTVLATATLKDTFPQDFCIYDLNQFLSVHSLGKDTELDFDTNNVIFKFGRSKTKYRMTAKNMIVSPPDKELKLPSIDGSFKLTEEDLTQALKNASVLQSPNLAFESDGEKVSVTVFNAKDDSAHTNTIQIGDATNDQVFKAVFLTENFKMIHGTYNVEISKAGLSHFKNDAGDLEYFIAIEAKDSKFGE
jgi:gp45 sliding clamp, C terminal